LARTVVNKFIGLIKWVLFPVFDTANQICMKFLGGAVANMSFGMKWLSTAVLSPYLWGAIGADIGSFLAWMLILKKSDLSFAAPFISVQYITILLAGWFLFHEEIYIKEIIGVVFIMFGLLLIKMDKSAKQPEFMDGLGER